MEERAGVRGVGNEHNGLSPQGRAPEGYGWVLRVCLLPIGSNGEDLNQPGDV